MAKSRRQAGRPKGSTNANKPKGKEGRPKSSRVSELAKRKRSGEEGGLTETEKEPTCKKKGYCKEGEKKKKKKKRMIKNEKENVSSFPLFLSSGFSPLFFEHLS